MERPPTRTGYHRQSTPLGDEDNPFSDSWSSLLASDIEVDSEMELSLDLGALAYPEAPDNLSDTGANSDSGIRVSFLGLIRIHCLI